MKRVFIIAEIGVNHNGNLDLAYKLVGAAEQARVDTIKFSTKKCEMLSANMPHNPDTRKRVGGDDATQLEIAKSTDYSNY